MLKRSIHCVRNPGVPSFLLGIICIAALTFPVWADDLTTAIIQVAKQNIPAVVHIEVTESQEVENPKLKKIKCPC